MPILTDSEDPYLEPIHGFSKPRMTVETITETRFRHFYIKNGLPKVFLHSLRAH
jgi:hypothetical protein